MTTMRKRNISSTTNKRGTASASTKRKSTIVEKKIRTVSRALGVNPSTLYAALVLTVAIATAIVWNALDTVDPAVRLFLRTICQDEATYCNEVLRPTHRTQKTTRDISAGQRLVEIPRRFLLWDLDALRDEFIRRELFSARIWGTQPLDADVFLAAYIALLQQNKTALSPVLSRYLSILPSYDDFAKYHPILWEKRNLTKILNERTYSYQLIRYKQNMIHLEYEALINASRAFADRCSWTAFVSARLAVLTRSFGTGRLHENERHDDHVKGQFHSLTQEMEFYHRQTGVNLTSGSFAMVPILDLYNHHARPTVSYSYDPVRRSFVIRSTGVLLAGQELWDSYGKHSDPHLYAKFGFVNGDGSEPTQASLATWHSLFVLANESEDDELLRYLSFDDGYRDCVKPEKDNLAYEWKILKHKHLRAMAHDPRFWTIVVGPRRPEARPSFSSASEGWPTRNNDIQILRMDIGVDTDVKGPVALCRLLAATHKDFDGRAISLLRDHLSQAGSYVLPQGSTRDPLEYRTLKCIDRLASQSLSRFGTTLAKAQDRLVSATVNLGPETRAEWTAAQLEFGELQTLDLVRGMTHATIRQEWPTDNSRQGDPFFIRPRPCSPGYLHPLLQDAQS